METNRGSDQSIGQLGQAFAGLSMTQGTADGEPFAEAVGPADGGLAATVAQAQRTNFETLNSACLDSILDFAYGFPVGVGERTRLALSEVSGSLNTEVRKTQATRVCDAMRAPTQADKQVFGTVANRLHRFVDQLGSNWLLASEEVPATPLPFANEEVKHLAVALPLLSINIDALEDDGEALVTPLEMAVDNKDTAAVKALLLAGANAALIGAQGGSLLTKACINQDLGTAAALIQAGAEVNVVDNDGRQPIHYAVMTENVGCLEALIGAGVDMNATDAFGNFPLSMAHDFSAVACSLLLIKAGADVNKTHPRWSEPMLHRSIRTGDRVVARAMIDAASSLRVRNGFGQCPHEVARSVHRYELAWHIANRLSGTTYPR